MMFGVRDCTQPHGYIGLPVRPVVAALGAEPAVNVIAASGGHVDGISPYVYFTAPLYFASALERCLRIDSEIRYSALPRQWVVEGHFDYNYNFIFVLYCPALHKNVSSLSKVISVFGFRRKRLNAELLTLAEFIASAKISRNY